MIRKDEMGRPKVSVNKEKPVVEVILDSIEPTETIVEKAPSVPDVKPEVRREYYEKVTWKGVMNVYKCKNCGHCENEKDDIILHVITHAPKSEQRNLFNKLVKEY